MDCFKFRVWRKKEEYMNRSRQAVANIIKLFILEDPKKDDYILMPYIGLKDKDNEEIYEKDILIDNAGEKYICEWGEIEAGFYLYQISSARTFYFPDFDKNELKIIGNIYENKELIGEE